MGRLSREEKRERMEKRREQRADKRNEGGGGFKHLLDTSNYEKVEFYSLKDGNNYLDILPYEVSSKNHPDGIPIGEDDYKLEVWQHENVGVNEEKVLCLKRTFNKKCPICEEQRRLLDAGADWNDAGPKALRAKFRVYYNVIDVSEDAEVEDVQIFETTGAEKWFDDLLEKESKAGEETIAFYDIEEGVTVVCRCAEDTFNKRKFYRPERIDFEERDEGYTEDIYDEVYPLDAMLKVPTYEEVAKIFLELDDEDVEPKKSRKKKEKAAEPEKKTRKRKAKEVEPAPNEPEEEEDTGSAGDCPYGHIFGIDFQKKDACKDCDEDKFEECGDESDRLIEIEKEKPEPAKKSKKEKSTRRRRR